MSKHERLSPSIWWLNLTQLLGAMNDNAFRLLAIYFAIHVAGPEQAAWLSHLGGFVFAIPFILLLPAAGVVADHFSKRDVIVAAKLLELLVMGLAVLAFASGRIWGAMAVLFAMGLQSTLFGPAKYGILPELASRDQLSRANGIIIGFTYLAIIFGTIGGAALEAVAGDRFALAALALVAAAAVGTLTAWPIARTPAAGGGRSASIWFFRDAYLTLRGVRGDRFLMLAILASAYFSFIGSFLQLNVIPYGIHHLGLSKAASGLLFLYAALGIGAGSLLAGKLSGRNIEFGVLPLAAFGLGAASLALGWAQPGLLGSKLLLVLAGACAGLFIVPLDAFIQWRGPREQIGQVIAAANWLGWLGVLGGSSLGLFLYGLLRLTPAVGFAILGGLTLALTVATVWVLPDFLVRFVAVTIARTIYRIRAIGVDQLPIEGGALLVANHVSYLDAVQILACQQRRIRFLMHRPIYERHKLRLLFRLMGCIPIAMDDPPRRLLASLQAARRALDDGYLVCIFAEGALTRNGLMRGFRPGFERIVRGSHYPIIPIYIGGTWGSLFSHYGKTHARVPLQLPYPISVIFGQPLPASSTAATVRQAIQELSCTYFEDRRRTRRPLGQAFIATARRNWRRPAISDTLGRRLTFGRTLAAALALGDRLAPHLRGQSAVGILLPPSAGGALANLALALRRLPTVNLNFTVSAEAFRSAMAQAGVQTVVSSRAFLEKVQPPAELPGLLLLEDLLAGLSTWRRLAALLRARCWPVAHLSPARGFRADELATIIFSSGTTGEPKGVMLSHHNLRSNVEALALVFRPRSDDVIAATLPLFHSFGFTAGLWFPLLTGMRVAYHPSPLEPARIAQMVREEHCTALFATPTFLLGYLRRAAPDDLRSLRHLITGAEKLKPRLADAFEERFGIRPREGFGATELSPVALLSLPDVGDPNDPDAQTGWKPGSVGHPVPGVAVRIVDPESGARLPNGTPGMLLVRGPNVMVGYLGKPEKTAEAVRDGWYWTGDIATVDDDGFVTITDRLARFSKIGGEMVPHMAIEEEYLRALGRADLILAVTAIPDERKGERLVVLHTAEAGDAASLHAIIERAELPNLWKPARDAYRQVDALPLTATGKLDLKGLRQLATN